MSNIAVSDLMTRKVSYVEPETKVRNAIKQMETEKISCLVVTEGDWPVGILTERDIVNSCSRWSGSGGATIKVADIMSAPLVTLTDSASLHDVLDLTEQKSIRHIPVLTQNGSLAGIITQTDIVKACAKLIR